MSRRMSDMMAEVIAEMDGAGLWYGSLTQVAARERLVWDGSMIIKSCQAEEVCRADEIRTLFARMDVHIALVPLTALKLRVDQV
jgi:hypothetical protein